MWKSRGRVVSDHSSAVGMCGLEIILRCAANASHKMKMNNISATNESRDPNEDTTFHLVNASG